MNISEIMTSDVEVIGPETSVADIARKMRDENVGALPVVEDDRILGMVTDRDIVVRGIADSRDPDATVARDVMSDDVVVCYENQTTSKSPTKWPTSVSGASWCSTATIISLGWCRSAT